MPENWSVKAITTKKLEVCDVKLVAIVNCTEQNLLENWRGSLMTLLKTVIQKKNQKFICIGKKEQFIVYRCFSEATMSKSKKYHDFAMKWLPLLTF